MPSSYSVSQILTIAKISEYLAGNASTKDKLFKNTFIDKELSKVIYMERVGIQNRYNLNPSDSTLIQTSNYLFDLLGKYSAQAESILLNQLIPPPTITNPANVSTTVGAGATFSVVVVSSITYTVQWYRNGVAIPGATGLSITLSNVQLTDSGSTFYAKATNASGSATSNSATLTVTALITVYAHYGSVDPFPNLSIGLDNFVYQLSQNIANNAPITWNWPVAAQNNQYELIKIPVGQSVKTLWVNTPLNQGTIPDAIFRAYITFGGFDYICSRVAMSIDSSQPNETFS